MTGKRYESVGGGVKRIHFLNEWADHTGLTQADIARRTGTSRANVSRWFSGLTPSNLQLVQLASFFKTTTSGLFMHPLNYEVVRRLETLTDDQKRRVAKLIDAAFINGGN